MKLAIVFLLYVLTIPCVFAEASGWKNDELAIKYYYNSQLQQDWAFRALQKVDLRDTKKVLDFGSGDGKITAAMSANSKLEVHGYDISGPMINLAGALHPRDAYPNLSFHLLRNNALPVNEEFDLVTSFCVFHLLEKPAETLHLLNKSLKKSGKLLLTIPAGGNKPFFDAVNKTFKKYLLTPPWTNRIQDSNFVNVRDINKLKKLAIESGFKPLKIEIVRNKNRYINKQGLTDWFIGTLTANWDITDDIRDEFFSDLSNYFLEACPDALEPSGAIRFELDRIDLLASKT